MFPVAPQIHPVSEFCKALSKLSSARPSPAQDSQSLYRLSKYKCLKVTPDTFTTVPIGRHPHLPEIAPLKPQSS